MTEQSNRNANDLGAMPLLEKLFCENFTVMVRTASRILSDRGFSADMAEDLVQETFLVAQRRYDRLAASPSPVGWLYKTLRNILGDTLRRQKQLQNILRTLGAEQEGAMVDTESLLLKYEGMISREALELLIRVYCLGQPYAAEAERLGISIAACKKRIQRARESFMRAFQEEI